MFGPFSPGDSLQVYRLQRKGISFDVQRDLMQPHRPLWEAWVAFLTQQAMGQPTYVLTDPHDGEAFVQVRYRPHQATADVIYLAPSLSEHQQTAKAWSRLLDAACIEAAGQGIQRVFVNLPASGAEVDVFHQAGFTLYAEEDIYRLDRHPVDLRGEPALTLRPQRAGDWPALQKLCVAITPQRVRQAEGGIALSARRERNCRRYVLPADKGDDLLAALTVCVGELALWLQVLLHPDARELAEGLIHWSLASLPDQPTKVTYCSVRQYENGVREALQESGFKPYATRALMVKHTVAWIKTPFQEPATALASSAEPVPPAYRINGESDLANPDGRLAAETE